MLAAVQTPAATGMHVTATLRSLAVDYSVGRVIGQTIRFSERDQAKLRRVLEAQGISPKADPGDWDGKSRIQASLQGRDEKFARRPVKGGRVFVKALGPLFEGSRDLRLPPRAHLDLRLDDALDELGASRHRWILLVENFEAFEAIANVSITIPVTMGTPLVVYRGDRQAKSTGLLVAAGLPVYVFGDLDPAGLGIAVTTPRFAGLVCPSLEQLPEFLSNPTLFERHLKQWQSVLDESAAEPVRSAWEAMKRARKGLSQEALLAQRVGLSVVGQGR